MSLAEKAWPLLQMVWVKEKRMAVHVRGVAATNGEKDRGVLAKHGRGPLAAGAGKE